MNALYGIWKRMVYWLNNIVVIGQIDQQWIIYSWVQSGGPVTTESIVRFDTWFELFEVFRKN